MQVSFTRIIKVVIVSILSLPAIYFFAYFFDKFFSHAAPLDYKIWFFSMIVMNVAFALFYWIKRSKVNDYLASVIFFIFILFEFFVAFATGH